MNIGMKIGGSFGLIILMIAAMVGYSYYSLKQAKDALHIIHQANERMLMSDDAKFSYAKTTSGLRNYVAYGDEKISQEVVSNFEKLLGAEKKLLGVARAEKKALLQSAIEETGKYRDIVMKDFMPVAGAYHRELLAGNYARAVENKLKLIEIARTIQPMALHVEKVLDDMSQANEKIAGDVILEDLRDADIVIRNTVILGIGMLIFSILVAVFLTNMVRRPLAQLSALADQYAGGDLRNKVTFVSDDEIGSLANALRKMNENMRTMVKDINSSAAQVTASSEELTAGAQQSAEASTNIAISITQVAEGSERQVGAVNETSAIVEQISATMQEVSATAGEMATMSEATAKAALEGKKSADNAVTQMGAVSLGAKQAQAAAEELKKSSEQIGEIVGLISAIAGQTNLLALNAAIEAARAGEQGRGFAVVAEEVRKLAEQSEQAARQIKSLVGSNYTSIGNVVGAIDVAIRDIIQGVEMVNVAGVSFGAINGQVRLVSDQVRSIAKAISEAAVGSQRIVMSIKEVENASRDAAAEAQNVSAATEEQSATMEEIAAASQAMAQLAIGLQAAVAKFKI